MPLWSSLRLSAVSEQRNRSAAFTEETRGPRRSPCVRFMRPGAPSSSCLQQVRIIGDPCLGVRGGTGRHRAPNAHTEYRGAVGGSRARSASMRTPATTHPVAIRMVTSFIARLAPTTVVQRLVRSPAGDRSRRPTSASNEPPLRGSRGTTVLRIFVMSALELEGRTASHPRAAS